MALHSVQIGLHAFYPGNLPIKGEDFLDLLELDESELAGPIETGNGEQHWIFIPVVRRSASEFEDLEEPTLSFDIEVDAELFKFAAFLDHQAPEAFIKFFDSTLIVSAQLEAKVDSSLWDFSLPPRLHSALARLNIPLRVRIAP